MNRRLRLARSLRGRLVRARAGIRRRPRTFAAAGFLAVLVLVAAGGALALVNGAPPSSAPARGPRARGRGAPPVPPPPRAVFGAARGLPLAGPGPREGGGGGGGTPRRPRLGLRSCRSAARPDAFRRGLRDRSLGRRRRGR